MSYQVYVGAYVEFDYREAYLPIEIHGCPQCGVALSSGKYCQECGTKITKFTRVDKTGDAPPFTTESIDYRLYSPMAPIDKFERDGLCEFTILYIPNINTTKYGLKRSADDYESYTFVELDVNKIDEYLTAFKLDFDGDLEIMLRHYDRMRINFGVVTFEL